MYNTYRYNVGIDRIDISDKDKPVLTRNFFVSDTHFGDKTVFNSFNRPFSNVDDMDIFNCNFLVDLVRQSNMVNDWYNRRDSIKNVLWIVGDFAHEKASKEYVQSIVNRLKESKDINEMNLILGEQDRLSKEDYIGAGFDHVCDNSIWIADENIIRSKYWHGGSVYIKHDPSCFNPYIKNELLIHGHIHFGNIQCDMSSKKPVNVGIDRWYSTFRDDFSLHDFGYFNNNRKVFEFFPNLYNNEFDIKHINYNEVYSVYINTIRKIDSIMKSELPYLI